MTEPKHCPYCSGDIERKGWQSYTCQKCKAVVYITVECSIGSSLLGWEGSDGVSLNFDAEYKESLAKLIQEE